MVCNKYYLWPSCTDEAVTEGNEEEETTDEESYGEYLVVSVFIRLLLI